MQKISTKTLVWNAVLATAVIIAIVALIASQPQRETNDFNYLAGNAPPPFRSLHIRNHTGAPLFT
jgi:hypothetical protein